MTEQEERASMAEEAIGLVRWHWREREPLTEHAYQEIVATIQALTALRTAASSGGR